MRDTDYTVNTPSRKKGWTNVLTKSSKREACKTARAQSRLRPNATILVKRETYTHPDRAPTVETVAAFRDGMEVAHNPDPLTVGLIVAGLVGAGAVTYMVVQSQSKSATTNPTNPSNTAQSSGGFNLFNPSTWFPAASSAGTQANNALNQNNNSSNNSSSNSNGNSSSGGTDSTDDTTDDTDEDDDE
jgi:hypothetical protein